MSVHRILVVDDDVNIRNVLRHILVVDGYEVLTARDGREGLAVATENLPDLILTDVDMPTLDGFEMCRRLKNDPATRFIPIVMVTGREASEDKVSAWDSGADDFLTKPLHIVEVRARCRSLLRIKDLVGQLDSAEAVAFAMARAVEAKCRYTWGHSERVTNYALALARCVSVPESDCEVLRKGAMLHDLGKIKIPDAILNKAGPLTADEYAIVKAHPAEGARIIEPLRSIRTTIPIIRHHHERMDGGGYPDGLFGGAIPLLARILSVADVYDALSSERPYRPALDPERCLQILHKDAAEGGLDGELVRCFAQALSRATTPIPAIA
ncbi:MAG TPA: HD domain-containing phosphohydrolase [Gemmataceae bacterium]|nr:HD domain-containing phosphohydrolase [Gemmataceae bacterium]